MYINLEDITRIMLGFAPERFPSEPGGPRFRKHMHALAARTIGALPPSVESPTPRFTGQGSRSTLRATRGGPQICGVQYSIPNRFRIDTPKRLKIAATQRKQSSRIISNRYKKTGVCNARLEAVPVAPDTSFPLRAGRPALRFRRVFVRHSIANSTQTANFAAHKIIRNAATD
jgi:hypothetical protein